MKLSGGGSIVNIAGVSGLTGNAGRSAYGASKGGVVMLSKAMATDLAPLGIRVNVIAPGPVESPLAEFSPSPHARKRWTDAIPLERYARPDEIAGAAVCNTYRLIVKIEYRSRIIFINMVLTHVQYDKGLWK